MENNLGALMHCDDKLRTTLHCDDKDKLRRKLVLLQREYLRTVQRLKRAERLEAVRNHVRSRITEQNLQDQGGPGVTSSPRPDPSSPPLTLDTLTSTAPSLSQGKGHTGGPVVPDNSGRSPVIRFLLPSDVSCPTTPDPALRLRSRRSRLRWERRWRGAEAGKGTDDGEEGQEQSKRMEGAGEGETESETTVEKEVVRESEELPAGSASESPSLLLTHWNTRGSGEVEGKERHSQEKRESETELRVEGDKECESPSLLLTCWSPVVHTEGGGQEDTQYGRGKETGGGGGGEEEVKNTREGQRCGRLHEESSGEDIEKNSGEKIEKETRSDRTLQIRGEKNEGPEKVGGEHDGKAADLLASYNLVEGLLFPPEYYVRTTRRMTLSQSQPDIQAVILSQLTGGRQRRGRGRGRGWNRHVHPDRDTHTDKHPVENTSTDFPSLTTAPTSLGSHSPSHLQADTSAQLSGSSQSYSEVMSDQISASQADVDACLSSTACTARPVRGRRRKRGRGRGKPLSVGRSPSLHTSRPDLGQASDNPQPTSTLASSSQSLPGSGGPEHCLVSEGLAPAPDHPQLPSTHTPATEPSSGVDGPESSPAPGCLENIYPIFRRSNSGTQNPPQMDRASWRSLLLPSSPPPQTPLLPLPSLPPGPVAVSSLVNFDSQQDFHLPDDQFASLKLHKLRQVVAATAVEPFTSHPYDTRRSSRHASAHYSTDQMTPLPLPLSLTPPIAQSPHPSEERRSTMQPVHLSAVSPSSARRSPKGPGDQQPENLHAESQSHANSKSPVQRSATDCVDQPKEQDTMNLRTHSQSNTTANCIHKPIDHHLQQQPPINSPARPADQFTGQTEDSLVGPSVERSGVGQSSLNSAEEETDRPGEVHHSEGGRCTDHQTEDKPVSKTPSYSECPPQEPSGDSSKCVSSDCPAVQTCKDAAKESSGCLTAYPSEPSAELPPDRSVGNPAKCPADPDLDSQLLPGPALASPPCPFLTPPLLPSPLPSSPRLPSLGLTPHPLTASLPLTSSPSAPTLTLPPPHSPSTQALSPPPLSPCLPLTPLPSGQTQASSNPPTTASQCRRVVPNTCPVPSVRLQGSGGQVGRSIPRQVESTEEMADECIMKRTHTLKAPAGGCLVDACCLPGPSGGLCVAAAGKWAVCVWDQTSASDWSLIHTWTFNEPVISVFPVLDAVGLVCVTLGQLEIREVRMLSCSSLLQVLLCEGVVQAVVGVAKSRMVSSSHSATGSTLQLFSLPEDSSAPTSQPLASPGVCVGALAAVDGLSDALIGSAEDGRLLVWNLRTGQLIQRISLGEGLSHTACLRGFSCCGVLFVLLQHQLLSSLEEEEKEAKRKGDEMFSKEEKEEETRKTALFSLVATNPLSGKSVVAARLYPPKASSGRLCEADVHGSSVVGLSQSGCVCVWELGVPGGSRLVWAPETEGWQLARWGGQDTLLTGHHNGDLTLYCYTVNQASLCHCASE